MRREYVPKLASGEWIGSLLARPMNMKERITLSELSPLIIMSFPLPAFPTTRSPGNVMESKNTSPVGDPLIPILSNFAYTYSMLETSESDTYRDLRDAVRSFVRKEVFPADIASILSFSNLFSALQEGQ